MDETRESNGMSSSLTLPYPARAVYKYSLGLSAADQMKPRLIINALREYYSTCIGVSAERHKFLHLLQNEDESIMANGPVSSSSNNQFLGEQNCQIVSNRQIGWSGALLDDSIVDSCDTLTFVAKGCSQGSKSLPSVREVTYNGRQQVLATGEGSGLDNCDCKGLSREWFAEMEGIKLELTECKKPLIG